MRLSTRARYALQSMIAIVRLGEESDQPVSLSRVSEHTGISRRYLEQLAVILKNASLLRSVSGRGGGYVLARRPDDIRVRDIVEAEIGQVSVVECVLHPEKCEKTESCECHVLYLLLNQQIGRVLESLTLADLTRSDRMREIRARLEEGRLDLSEILARPAKAV